MRTTAMLSIMALAFVVAPALSAQDTADTESKASTGIAWSQDYSEALKTAEAEGKRLFIEFTAEW